MLGKAFDLIEFLDQFSLLISVEFNPLLMDIGYNYLDYSKTGGRGFIFSVTILFLSIDLSRIQELSPSAEQELDTLTDGRYR